MKQQKKLFVRRKFQKANGPPILSNLAKAFKKIWLTGQKNDQIIKMLKRDYVIPSNCQESHVSPLNEEILKTKAFIPSTNGMTTVGLEFKT